MKHKRQQLKSVYYAEEAEKINQAAEMRNIEVEFSLVREFKMSKRIQVEKKCCDCCKA